MRILVVNWQDIRNPLSGGAEVHLHQVFSRIARMGHDVTLYCSAFPGASPEEELDGIRIIRQGSRYLFNYRFLVTYLRRFRGVFDIVVDDMNKIPFFTPLYVKEPVFGVTHHLFGTSIFREANLVLACYVFLAESAAVWFYKRRRIPFIVGSPSTHAELLEKGFDKELVTIINYAVDHSLHAPDPSARSKTPLIGYFGRLKRYKSVEYLLRAIPHVVAEVPDLRIVIVGDGDDRPRLQQIAVDLGLAGRAEFRGFVTEEEKVMLLQKMWFKVATSSKEGWGLTVIEANACGTPVIASNVPGLRDAVRDGETGLLYEYGNIEDLASKATMLLKDRGLRERLANNAFQWASTFDWNVAARRTLELLEERASQRY